MAEVLAMRQRFVELAPWHVNGTVSAVDRAWVDGYVRWHPEARAELEWYASLQQEIRADAPEVSPDAGLERLLHRVRLERQPSRPEGGLASLLGPVRDFFAGIVKRPAFAYAAMALVVAQAGLIGAVLFEQQATKPEYAGYRSMATVEAIGPLLRVTFKAEAKEFDIRGALVDVGGTLVGGPGQLGEYLVRVPPEKVHVAAARLRANMAVEAVEVSSDP
jgi:hypothetical protein